MTIRSPFKPHYGSNQVVTPAVASAQVGISKDDKSVRVVNTGANIGYFRTGTTADNPAATVADVPVPAGQSIIIEKPQDHDKMATISALGTTFQVMTGEGGV